MNRKAISLVEILLAITILSIALVPMAGGFLSYFKRTSTIEGSMEYMHRAQNILNDLLYEVSYRETQRVLEAADGGAGVDSASLTARSEATVNLMDIKKRKFYAGGAGGDVTALLCPEASMHTGDTKGDNTPDGYWLTGNSGHAKFKLNNVEYDFELKIKNIPLNFHWQQYELNDARDNVESNFLCTMSGPADTAGDKVDVVTINQGGIKRDMFQQITLIITWSEYNRNLSYSFVTFKANLDDAYDAFDANP